MKIKLANGQTEGEIRITGPDSVVQVFPVASDGTIETPDVGVVADHARTLGEVIDTDQTSLQVMEDHTNESEQP